MKKLTLTTAALMLAGILNATTVSFTAQQGTGISNSSGTALTGTTVEIGYYDSSTFTSLGSTTSGTPFAGMFGGSSLFESVSLASFQPALKIFSDDGSSVIAYSTDWAFLGGDGTGIDTNTQSVDLANVVFNGSLTASGVVIASAGSAFDLNAATNPTFGAPSLEISLVAVPEPSAFAALAGLCALGAVMVRRRRA